MVTYTDIILEMRFVELKKFPMRYYYFEITLPLERDDSILNTLVKTIASCLWYDRRALVV